ncbi:MAG: DUF3043 domain-containing protein [Actinomycetota bacterium]|nr:DUF3043 domain-containing protein [Actinomycetota bacterium]
MFGRRSATDAAEARAEAERAELEAAQGKGRATPKRKEAEAARKKRLTPPRTRKEANALHKQRVRGQRGKQREAMAGGGDDRYLPARDQGPVKKLIRDYVDSHRTIGEFLIPVFLIMFVLAVVLSPFTQYIGTFAWLTVLVVLGLDSVRILRGVKKVVSDRFGAAETRGITMYALMRSWQMRRLRLPKATVRPGDQV